MEFLHPPAAAPARPLDVLADWADGPHGTLVQKLASSVRQAIRSGLLPSGTMLPAERRLAATLAVSRSTVTTALDMLRSEGLLASTQGQGTVVVGRDDHPARAGRVAGHLLRIANTIDLATGNPPDPRHLPPLTLTVNDLLAADAGPGLDPLGQPSLRRSLAEWYTTHGLHTSADEIHVLDGAHQATAAAVATEVGAHGAVAIDRTNYPGLFDILDSLGAETVPIDADDDGVRPDRMATVLASTPVRAIYVQAGAHNPTGRALPDHRLRAIAELADRHGVTVIDDHTIAPLRFDGQRSVPMAQRCQRAPVVTVGSMSKVCWAGLRIGWLRAGTEVIQRTLRHRLGTNLGSSVPSQLLAEQLLPHYDEIAKDRTITLQRSVDRSLQVIADDLPDWSVRRPDGGSGLWIRLPIDDTAPFTQLARRHGVLVAPGSIAVAGNVASPYVRVCVDRPWELVSAGLERLRHAWLDHTA